MATAQRSSATPGSVPAYEAQVEKKLRRARRRMRGLDYALEGAVIASAVIVYGLVVSLADRIWDLSTGIRLTAWCFFVTGLATYVALAVRRLVLREVNPHFLARRLEQTVPDAKNSIMNWLDLREKPLPPVIRGSLGRRAASDLTHADPERAISAGPVLWASSVLGVALLLQLGWLIAAPGQALSLLQRAFFPFDKARIALRTELTLLKPQGGNVAVPANQPVQFRVQAQGHVPPLNQKDSLKLQFRYHSHEQFEERALQRDVDGTWATTVLADQVRSGFWYRITGGDAQLPEGGEYRVDVRSAPQIVRYETTFKYRPYLLARDRTLVYEKNVQPSIRELRGTEMTLTVKTNRSLERCVLELKTASGTKNLVGTAIPGDAESWSFKCVLDQNGELRVVFQSKEGEENVDRQLFRLEVIPDRVPEVVLTKPAKDLTLPANGILLIDGQTTDDFGVKSMQLEFRLLKAPEPMPALKAKPYRPGKSFQLVDGHYPMTLDYSDYVALDAMQKDTGEPFPLQPGMELEYWLTARDNCDYPDANGNVGHSTRYKVIIGPRDGNSQHAADSRAAAEKQTKDKQGQQDKAIGDQNQVASQKEGGGGGGQGAGDPGQGKQPPDAKNQEDLARDAQKVQDALNKDNNAGTAKTEDKGQDGQGNKGSNGQGAGDDQSQAAPGTGKDQGGNKDGNAQPPGNSNAGDSKKEGNETKEGKSKGGGKDKGGDAKGSSGAETGGLSQEKGRGDQGEAKKGGQGAHGDAKTWKPTDQAADPNTPPIDKNMADAKGRGEPSKEAPPAGAKPGEPDPSMKAGEGKSGDLKGANLDDVAKLREQLGDASQRDGALKDLDKMANQAADEKVRQAAEKALENAKGQPGLSKIENPGNKTAAQKSPGKGAGKPDGNDPGNASGKSPTGQDQSAKGKPGDKQGQTAAAAKNPPEKVGTGNPGPAKSGNIGPDGPANPNPIDEAAAKRAGNLQLENIQKEIDKLRDKMTPDVLKDLNWTPQQAEEFLRKMQDNAVRRLASDEKMPQPGSIQSLLPGTGPRILEQGAGGGQGSVSNERAEAPPEVQEALRIFQGGKK